MTYDEGAKRFVSPCEMKRSAGSYRVSFGEREAILRITPAKVEKLRKGGVKPLK
jgi:hypothetical protein